MHRDRVEHDLDRPFAADLAGVRRRIGHALKPLESMASRTPVLVDRHEGRLATSQEVLASRGRPRRGRKLAFLQALRRLLVTPARGQAQPGPALPTPQFAAGVAACAVAVGVFLFVQLTAWPPHEDETLALFAGRKSFSGMLHTVLAQRGGAPLHFVIAWLVVHAGGGLTALRVVSALLAVASVPVVALLSSRLAGRTVALATTVLVSGSWILLFHGVYARMYTLFLLTSALSFLALLRALDGGGRRRWALWGAAILVTIATHPYGALVLAAQGVYALLRRERVREAAAAFGAVVLVAVPFWRTDLVLAHRFDVGVGGGRGKLGAPWRVAEYLWQVAGDFSAGWSFVLVGVLALAALGLWRLWVLRRDAAVLSIAVFAVPAAALTLARLGSSTSPESRHLIFALPFFSTLVGAGVVEVARRRWPFAQTAAVLVLAALVGTEVAWANRRTPPLFAGQPSEVVKARTRAAAWLSQHWRPDDVLFGYEPVYLRAWEMTRRGSQLVVPRADPKLALKTLRSAPEPLGRGVWVFDASDASNGDQRATIPARAPRPRSAFTVHRFGPYLIVMTRKRTQTPRRYLELASAVMVDGKDLLIGDANVNFVTVRRALARL